MVVQDNFDLIGCVMGGWMCGCRGVSSVSSMVQPLFKIHPGPRTIRVKQIARHEYRHNAWSEEVKSYNFPFILEIATQKLFL